MAEIEVHDFITRIEPEPENDKPGWMQAFDEIVTGPLDSIHIERMSDDTYWMVLCKGECSQRITFASASGRAKIVGRTEAE
jgi:hypothetical protein